MKKYFLNDGTGQQGPFDLEELKSKNITAETLVWYEGLPETTKAGQLDELKDFFLVTSPAVVAPVDVLVEKPAEEILIEESVTPEPIVTTTEAAVTTADVATPAAATATKVVAAKKSTAWLSWVLTLLVLGGAGYFVYQDMEKNKAPDSSLGKTEATTDSTTTTVPTTTELETDTDTATSPDVTSTNSADTAVTTSTTDPVTTTTTTTATTNTTTATTNTAQQTAAKKAAAKKAEDEKKKQLAIAAQKKADADQKKQQAAQAAIVAREMEMRNNWPKYISVGNLNYETKGDGVKAFDVPVYNGTDATLDKVTVRVEYTKKSDRKIVKTETITVYNIPPRSTVNGKAPESKKGDKANVILTGMISRKLHFCFPQNNGNAADPYYCN
ncbi:MAG: DUF4339 domain-containing protein [Bacteroidota bacterium]|nr:DUF4339 domain-containing protein [Bacteroidota bacterium]